jgi:ribonucleoside-diphosphate reductase alpha chain
VEAFCPDKLNNWAFYAAEQDVNWSEIALATQRRLSGVPTTADIHQTMIKVCLEKQTIAHSRVAGRLLKAELKQAVKRNLGLSDREDVEDWKTVSLMMRELGHWTMQQDLSEYSDLYRDLRRIEVEHMEYWQVKQWMDKYSLRSNGKVLETVSMGVLALAVSIFGDKGFEHVSRFAMSVMRGEINLPTPLLNGVRNGDLNFISCSVITGTDTVESIGVAEHLSYVMTARKAGIGIEVDTRSKGAPVKNGRVEHLGKHPIYAAIDKAVKMFTQVTRGGSATVTYKVIDPEIMDLLYWKSQRVPESIRLDKLDFSMAYNEAFIEAVRKDYDWFLFDLSKHPLAHELFYDPTATYDDFETLGVELGAHSVKAREILKAFLTVRQESGRLYCFNVSRANSHTPFFDTVRLSNLCQEICLPTSPYTGMEDLYSEKSSGEMAFCTLAAINVSKIESWEAYENACYYAVWALNILIDRVSMKPKSLEYNLKRRRSLGIGITGLAGLFIKHGVDYDSTEAKELAAEVAEHHYYYCLKASQELVTDFNEVKGVDLSWLPIDTMVSSYEPKLDWESLRGLPRVNSVLVAHMPTESSAVFSDAPNGLYPIRQKVIEKVSRKGGVQYIAPEGNYKLAWDIPNNAIADVYGAVQDFTDQGISADYYIDFRKYPSGKVPMSQLMKEWVYQAMAGVKSMYYQNTNDSHQEEDECESCKL